MSVIVGNVTETKNDTIVISPGVSLNLTFENFTGGLIKKSDIPSLKTIAIGIITLVIIIILIIRFAILVGK